MLQLTTCMQHSTGWVREVCLVLLHGKICTGPGQVPDVNGQPPLLCAAAGRLLLLLVILLASVGEGGMCNNSRVAELAVWHDDAVERLRALRILSQPLQQAKHIEAGQ